jgi:hypothetical protein
MKIKTTVNLGNLIAGLKIEVEPSNETFSQPELSICLDSLVEKFEVKFHPSLEGMESDPHLCKCIDCIKEQIAKALLQSLQNFSNPCLQEFDTIKIIK